MTINHIFLAFMALVGGAIGAMLVVAPQSRDFRVSPYFWVLIAMAIFELAMEARLCGFVLAIVLMVVIPILSGAPTRLF